MCTTSFTPQRTKRGDIFFGSKSSDKTPFLIKLADMAHVFVSHRGTDATEAERLASRLRDAGHEVWLDSWKLEAGASIVDRINDGLKNATHLILCYSSSGIDTEWIKREWQPALALQLAGQGVKIIPVRLTGGSPPPILADIFFIDLTTDWGVGVQRLIDTLAKDGREGGGR
jgi:hypothetical protein